MKYHCHRRTLPRLLTSFLIVGLFPVFLVETVSAQESKPGKAKNIIVFIGDGMGFNSDLAGTYYRYGEAGKQSYHSFPVFMGCTTFSRAKKDEPIPADCKGYDPEVFWISPHYGNQGTEFTRTTDSAAASTALFSGIKTTSGKIGMSPHDEPIELISEIAVKLGKKAGSVTTVPLSHATPAGFSTHEPSRGNMDKIFLQMTAPNSHLSVVMGGGNPLFSAGNPIKVKENESEKERTRRFLAVGGEETWKKLETGSYNGFTVLRSRKQLEELAAGKSVPDKVIGLPYESNYLSPSDGWLEDVPETKERLDDSYKKRNWDEIPSLATMTMGAINVLSKDNDKGFVLMVEGGAIDGANHGQNVLRNSFEHTGFSKAIDATLAWIEKNSSWDETLVIITSDHETGQCFGPDTYSDDNENGVFDEGDTFNEFTPLENNGRGKAPEAQYAGKSHSNALVPLWAKGPGATLFLQRVKGTDAKAGKFWNFSGKYVDNTDVFHVMKTVLAP